MRRVAVLVIIALLAGCGGTRSVARSAPALADELLAAIRKVPVDDLAAGTASGVDDTLRANPALQEAIAVAAFRAAVDEAALVAEGRVREGVRTWFGHLDEFAQARVESKFKTMICEAALQARDPAGDLEAFRPWIAQELTALEVPFDEVGLTGLTPWLVDQVSDMTSNHSLACFAWLRLSR